MVEGRHFKNVFLCISG